MTCCDDATRSIAVPIGDLDSTERVSDRARVARRTAAHG